MHPGEYFFVFVGQTSRSAADVHVGLLEASAVFAERVREDPRRPGGLPHTLRNLNASW